MIVGFIISVLVLVLFQTVIGHANIVCSIIIHVVSICHFFQFKISCICKYCGVVSSFMLSQFVIFFNLKFAAFDKFLNGLSSVIYLFFLVEHYNTEEISKLPRQQTLCCFKSATSCAVSTNED